MDTNAPLSRTRGRMQDGKIYRVVAAMASRPINGCHYTIDGYIGAASKGSQNHSLDTAPKN
jgi:hypothetical protein